MTQRIAIIGGGVAGLAFAIYYKKLGGRVDIYERSPISGREGLGFIVLENGMQAMARLGLEPEVAQVGFPLNNCLIKDSQGDLLKKESLSGSYGMARKAFIDILLAQIPEDWLHFDHKFSHFEWNEDNNAQSAVFHNGAKIEADIFIGCDGNHSVVRSQVFPEATRSNIRVKELVSIVPCPTLIEKIGHNFVKYKSLDGGLAVGMVPADQEHLVWYLQFDSQKYDIEQQTAEAKQSFVNNLVGNWDSPIPELLELTDFERSYVWYTCYLQPLERFNHNNVILLGDAAHALLTFTSQGINSAIEDAVELAQALTAAEPSLLDHAISQFSQSRLKIVNQYLQDGIALQNEFLQRHDEQQKIPLCF